ncbi:universal stress protein [Asanoa sp. WMMD1127]|uniref:universal stress protein n=1 Tax=Asanoa sp. WMMD1127 TaxID=3016107 RepID=UPI002417F437|nr:universal stress protein [Asanoa sp. WMMD1127]MDG4825345.1 universal stress protein [Asanoa sp. WMMD1127]
MDHGTILVGYDGSAAARAAVGWALDEARRSYGRVRLVEVVEWPVRVGPATPRAENWPRSETYRDAERAVARTVSVLAEANPDVPVDGLVVEGPAAAMLADLSSGALLVVVGNRGRGGVAGLLIGSVAAEVVTHAAGPVAVVRAADAGRPARGLVVVGVDDSPGGRAAVSTAFAEASARNAPLTAVRAWPPPGRPRGAVADPEAAEVLTDLLAEGRRAHPAVTVTTRVPSADPAAALVDASRDAQLVVIGSGRRGGFRGLRVGATARQLLRYAHCPVLVARAADATADLASATVQAPRSRV